MNRTSTNRFAPGAQLLAARKQLARAQSDKIDFSTNRGDGLDRRPSPAAAIDFQPQPSAFGLAFSPLLPPPLTC